MKQLKALQTFYCTPVEGGPEKTFRLGEVFTIEDDSYAAMLVEKGHAAEEAPAARAPVRGRGTEEAK